MKNFILLLITTLAVASCNHKKETTASSIKAKTENMGTTENIENPNLKIHPVSHASMVLEWDGTVIYVDPVGGGAAYSNFEKPNLILVTDIHGDHLDVPTLEALTVTGTQLIAPKAVFDLLPENLQNRTFVLNNGETTQDFELSIEAIPMYNLRKEALKFHEKGRGNGYVLERNRKRVYISGDTEDIPEMRNLKNIDIAFVCMNLPYTMPVESAAEAVLAFAPKTVYPYHYRGAEGLSDVEKFKSLVENGNPDIEVVQLDWYPKKQ